MTCLILLDYTCDTNQADGRVKQRAFLQDTHTKLKLQSRHLVLGTIFRIYPFVYSFELYLRKHAGAHGGQQRGILRKELSFELPIEFADKRFEQKRETSL